MAAIQQSIKTLPDVPTAGRQRPVAGAFAGARRLRTSARLVTRILRMPLGVKLLGANVLIAAAALGAALTIERRDGAHPELIWILAVALGLAFVANVVLVQVALRPLRALIDAAERVRSGALDARVPTSRVADRDLVQLSRTMNSLLDELGAERARLRELAAQVIGAGDTERERIARELHDSTAQRVAALVLHLGAVLNDGADGRLRDRLAPAKQLADDVLEELRTLAHVMHPRVLHDLGLPHALDALARETTSPTCVVETDLQPPATRLSIEVESVLYRVAQEAVSNALRHGAPTRVRVELRGSPAMATLVVEDDGRGFDTSVPTRDRESLGLFTMRERVSLVDGTLEITSRPGAGTRVRVAVPRHDHTEPRAS